MFYEIIAILLAILAITIILKLHEHITRTVRFAIIIILLLFAYTALMNMVSYKTYDLTSPTQIIKATTFHVTGIIDFITNRIPEKETITGNNIKEKQEKEQT